MRGQSGRRLKFSFREGGHLAQLNGAWIGTHLPLRLRSPCIQDWKAGVLSRRPNRDPRRPCLFAKQPVDRNLDEAPERRPLTSWSCRRVLRGDVTRNVTETHIGRRSSSAFASAQNTLPAARIYSWRS